MQLKVHIKVYTSINRAESKSSLDEYTSYHDLFPTRNNNGIRKK